MLAALLILSSTFAMEASSSIAKQSIWRRRENVYDLAFIGLVWGLVFILLTMLFGAEFRIDPRSIPFLAVRMVLEALMSYIVAESTIRADRTTSAFLRLITIPLLLVVDISLGYKITNLQLTGIAIMFFALVLAFRHHPRSQRGAWLAALAAVISVATISLYKYDITNFNSVVGEQTVVLAALIGFFAFVSARHGHRSPWRLLIKPQTGTQALLGGLSVPLESFAMSLAPASVIITLKRSLALLWAIIFGGTYFHENSLWRKTSSAFLLMISLVLIASPTLFHH